MRFSRLRSIAVAFIAILILGCAGGDSRGEPPAASVLAAVSRGNPRVLDTLSPSRRFVTELRAERTDGPYIVARALESRGRREAARSMYELELGHGVAPWAGLSAHRLATMAVHERAWFAAARSAEEAVDLIPAFPDAWFVRGEALYRGAAYDELLSVSEEILRRPAATEHAPGGAVDDPAVDGPADNPTNDPVDAGRPFGPGEAVSRDRLRDEALLWRAVAAWETEDRDRRHAAFRDAVIRAGDPAIAERLYLYLYYRPGSLASFTAEDRLAMESAYRAARGEDREALRLLRAVEPSAMVAMLEAAAALGPGRPVWDWGWTRWIGGLAVRSGDAATQEWLDRLRTAAETRQWSDAVAAIDALRARAALAAGDPWSRAGTTLVEAARGADSAALRERIMDQWLTGAVDAQVSLTGALTQLAALDASPAQFATAVDQLLPVVVRRRDWGAVGAAVELVPTTADEARAHLVAVRTLAAEMDDATAWDEQVDRAARGAEALPAAHRYVGFLARRLAGAEMVVAAETSAQPDSTDPDTPEMTRAVAPVAALLAAGDDRRALAGAMALARDPERAPEMVALAAVFREDGYVSHALDVARRAGARGDLPLTESLFSLLYPLPYRDEIVAAAADNGVPAAVLAALVREESHFRPVAQSPVGARGLGQIMPGTADDIRRRMEWPEADETDPSDNLRMSAYHLAFLAERIRSPILRLAAYNAGLGRGQRWEAQFGDLPAALQIEAIPFLETRWYVRKIAVSYAAYARILRETPMEQAATEFLEGAIW